MIIFMSDQVSSAQNLTVFPFYSPRADVLTLKLFHRRVFPMSDPKLFYLFFQLILFYLLLRRKREKLVDKSAHTGS